MPLILFCFKVLAEKASVFRRQAFDMSQHGFLMSEKKMLTLININTLDVCVLVCPAIFMDTVVNGDHIVRADSIISALFWHML